MVFVLDQNRKKHAPVAAVRRGECPTLQRPMQTGDGLLARLRVPDNAIRFSQMAELARAARAHGNGLIEITARGSLQIRGLKPETVAPFEAAVLDAGLRPLLGTSVETAPLAGVDPEELVDMRPMAEQLRARLSDAGQAMNLAPKLAITLDGGGAFSLRDQSADIKATAFLGGDGKLLFSLQAGGTFHTARSLAVVAKADLVDAIMIVLQALSSMGPGARGRDLPSEALQKFFASKVAPPAACGATLPFVGLHVLANDSCLLGLAFPYGQVESKSLIQLSDIASSLGAEDLRLSPDHAFLVVGLDKQKAEALKNAAIALGFIADDRDVRCHISLCAGAAGCASAFYDTRALATKLIGAANNVLDGSLNVHLSGCSKGCAHPASSVLTLAGASSGYGLVVNGAASSAADIYIAEDDIASALAHLSALVEESKGVDETAAACLMRLGAKRIVSALQLDRT